MPAPEAIGTIGNIQGGVIDQTRYVGTVDQTGFIGTIGTIQTQIEYTSIVASLSPATVSGTFISSSFDSSRHVGGIGFSIAYIGGETGVSGTIYFENSIDNTNFRTVGSVAIPPGGQDDRVFSPTRPYWRFTAINPSTLAATIEAVIARMPPGA